MLDVKQLINDFESVAAKLGRKNIDMQMLAALREKASETKAARQGVERLLTEQNEKSRLFPVFKKEGKDTTELKAELDALKAKITEGEEKLRALDEALEQEVLLLPNTPDDDVPDGEGEEQNVLLKEILQPKEFSFAAKDHVELGEKLGWLDFERAAKLTKSRFVVVQGEAARLERALINYMLDFNRQRGFAEVSVPFIVNRQTMTGTGQLPKFEDDLYKLNDADEERDFFLIPTAEVPLTNLYADEIIHESHLPLKLTAHTPCFRKEAGSAGRDTRGMIRQHQFHKVEIVAITKPEQSDKLFDEMLSCASELLTGLLLPHRLMTLCTGDLGFSAAKTVDIEVWMPSQGKYREISSVSNCRDFQARRAKIRYKDEKGKNLLVHTLNGSSLAVGRTMIAIMENHQNEDGTINIPPVLSKYM